LEEEADGYKLLLQSHTTANSAVTMKVNCSMVQITDPPHSRDLEPAEFFLFLKVKTALNRRYSNTRNIRKNTLAKLNAVPLDIFNDLFIQLFEIHKKCVTVKGV